jgi:hypothetical protein
MAQGIELIPLSETKSILQGARMLSKNLPGSFVTSYRAIDDGVTPLVSTGPDLTLYFAIKIDNLSETVKISDLGAYKSGCFLVFDNDPANASTEPNNPEVLNMTIADSVRPKRFSFSANLSPAPALVDFEIVDEQNSPVSPGNDSNGNPLPNTIPLAPDSTGAYSQQIDLSGKKDGIYTIRLTEGAIVRFSTSIYFSNELAGSEYPGVVRIKYKSAPAHLYGNTEQYALQFNRKSTHWQYFIVHKSGTIDLAAHTLAIEDGSGITTPYPAVTFATQGAIPNATIAINGFDTAVFRSNQLIPFFEQPKLNLRLREVNGGFDKLLIEHLPNPTSASTFDMDGSNALTNIIVFV